jgi:hypothetical protein
MIGEWFASESFRYKTCMSRRFVIEHLPRSAARYDAIPLSYGEVKSWLQNPSFTSLVRTTELISAVEAGMHIPLKQADRRMRLSPGDEALLIGLSFSVLLAWVEGNITPLPDDWRCFRLRVKGPGDTQPDPRFALAQEMPSGNEPLALGR